MQKPFHHPGEPGYEKSGTLQEEIMTSDTQRGIRAFWSEEDPEYNLSPVERLEKIKQSKNLAPKALERADGLIKLEKENTLQVDVKPSCNSVAETPLVVVAQPAMVVPPHTEAKGDINACDEAQEIRVRLGFVYVSNLIFTFFTFCHQIANVKMLKTIVVDYLKSRYGIVKNGGLVKEILFFLDIPPQISNGIPHIDYRCIAFQNGALDVFTGKMRPPDPSRFLLHLVQADYRPDLIGKCSNMIKFVKYITGGNSILEKRLWQTLAFIVSNVYAKYFVVFVGVGDSGKSMLIKLIESIFAPSSCVAMTYQKLAARFSTSALNGMKLCVCPDLPKKAISNEAAAVIKMITGGDSMTAEAKYKDQEAMMIDGLRLVCGSNFPLMLKDHDPAMDKRTLNIVFPYAVPNEMQDPYLLEKLISEKEAIIATALSFLPELISNNFQFDGEYETRAILEGLYGNVPCVAVSDQIASFIERYIAFEEGVYTPTDDLFNAFNTYAPGVVGDSAAFSKLFRDGLVAIGRSDIIGGRLTIAGKKQRGYRGLKLIKILAQGYRSVKGHALVRTRGEINMDKNYNKVSFNLQQEANAKFREMLDKGSYSNKTELLNEAILALYNKCSVADVSQESFAGDKVEHQFSHGHAKSCVERCDVVCETDFHQMLPDDYCWSLLAYLINPYLYPAPNLYWC